MTFNIGDKAVYPGHGVGEVVAIERRDIGGYEQTFYALRILDNGMQIMVPTNNVRAVGLRGVISKGEVSKVFKVLKAKKRSVRAATWSRRHREYLAKIKSGSPVAAAEVLCDLYLTRRRRSCHSASASSWIRCEASW